MAIAVKFVTDQGIPAGEVVMWRFLFGLLTLQVLSGFNLIEVSHKRARALMGRGITGGVAILLYFLSIQHTTLTKATLLSNSYPVFAALFGVLVLRERMTFRTLLVFVASMVGVWLVVNPRGQQWVLGDIYGVIGAAAAGSAIVFIRHLRQTENPFSIFWYLCAFGTGLGAFTCMFQFVWPDGVAWVWILVMGISSTLGQLLITYGFGYCRAGEGSLITMSTVAYSGLFAWFALGERMPLAGIAGAGVIVACAGYLAARPTPQSEASISD